MTFAGRCAIIMLMIGKIDSQEIDFVAQSTSGELAYYQVAWTANDPITFAREMAPLNQVRDNYPKFLITADSFESDNEGVRRLPVTSFLLES